MKNLKKKLGKNGGFTLVEMLIVVAIIAILVAVSIPLVSSSLENARERTDEANERSAKAEAVIVYLNGDYTNDASGFSLGEEGTYTATYYASAGTFVTQTGDNNAYGQCSDHNGGHLEVTLTAADGSVALRWAGMTGGGDGTPHYQMTDDTDNDNGD